jgi:hypothetical protein
MRSILVSVIVLAAASAAYAQPTPFGRLSSELLDVVPPSARVTGAPGSMAVRQAACGSSSPAAEVRRRIVDIAVQEWAFFGFSVVDQARLGEPRPPAPPDRRRLRWLSPEESARVADSIAGYWAVTPDGRWILDRQNEAWNGPSGVAARWRYPWSAAFISWVMCEAGLGSPDRFERAVAHHAYIDQAIRARDDRDRRSAFEAFDIGEAPVRPGDLLCSARRPAYRSIADRRRQMGEGARTHCDIVVKLHDDAESDAERRILAIGGNVRGSVGLKILPAVRTPGGNLHPRSQPGGRGARTMFAHLQLRAVGIETDALDRTPTMKALACGPGLRPPAVVAAAKAVAGWLDAERC